MLGYGNIHLVAALSHKFALKFEIWVRVRLGLVIVRNIDIHFPWYVLLIFCDFVIDGQIPSLVELSAQAVARHIPFEVVEHFQPPVPVVLQCRITFWSFPENEEDIR